MNLNHSPGRKSY